MSLNKEFSGGSEFANLLRGLAKNVTSKAFDDMKRIVEAFEPKEKDKIKYVVYLYIEAPDNAVKEVIDTLIIQRRFFSNYNYFERYKKINVKVNEDIGKKILNVYLYVMPADSFTFNINDERAIFEILKQEKDFFKNSFSIDDLYEKLAIVVDTFSGSFKKKNRRKNRGPY